MTKSLQKKFNKRLKNRVQPRSIFHSFKMIGQAKDIKDYNAWRRDLK
jgi:hypothetical protein